ncbi:MAG: hypothetical protein OJF49_002611 [Ktedonobacterales bacterium]|nr:MAG: hypothetical protein OJF49_002611 [Ktedonobacterales bacterium]
MEHASPPFLVVNRIAGITVKSWSQTVVTGSSPHDASVASIARQNWTRIGAATHDLSDY